MQTKYKMVTEYLYLVVAEPPVLTRVCPCFPHCKPFIPVAPESFSLEFTNVPLKKGKIVDVSRVIRYTAAVN